jgi:glycosyltransferase involved in cell wall biosynthesis
MTCQPSGKIPAALTFPGRGIGGAAAGAGRSGCPAEAVAAAPVAHLLHVFPSFAIGGVPLRMARVINHFGRRFRHTVIALDDNFEAGRALADDLDVVLLPNRRSATKVLRSIVANVAALRRHRADLLLTYNWGAIEWAMAARLQSAVRHVHFEAGFGKEEADRQILRRVLFRRWALARRTMVVVPSRVLEDIARRVWHVPGGRVIYLPNGVDVERFSDSGGEGVARRPGELIVGTVAPLRPEKNVGRLLRVFAALAAAPSTRLVIAGGGAERQALESLARELGIADRVVFAGQVLPETVLGTFDVFALSSDTEQMPNALLEAMAAGRAVAAVDVGDVKGMVCEENRDYVVPRDDGPAFVAALARLLADPAKRGLLGRRNREKAIAEFSDRRMFAAYEDLFCRILTSRPW